MIAAAIWSFFSKLDLARMFITLSQYSGEQSLLLIGLVGFKPNAYFALLTIHGDSSFWDSS